MQNLLSVSIVKDLVKKAELSFRHQECINCECYLGYLAQLEIDADDKGKEYLKNYRSEQGLMHACLGCDPCPPGILYENYLRKRKS